MAGILIFLVLQLFCSTQIIFAQDNSGSLELQRRIEVLEKQGTDINALNLRQQQMIEEQAKQLERTNDLIVNLKELVVSQASEIEMQRNQIEDLNQHVHDLSTRVKRQDSTELLSAGIAVLKNKLKACTVLNAELLQQPPLVTHEHSDHSKMPNIKIKSSEKTVTNSDAAQRSSRFVMNREGPFAFHAVSDKHEISHITSGQNIVFETVLLNMGGALHSNHSLFIAEMPGVYLFSASILSFVNTHSEFTAALVKNGGNLALVYGHGDAGRHDQGSVTVVTKLNAGDEVWVKLLSPSDDSIYGARYTTFSGVLLYSL